MPQFDITFYCSQFFWLINVFIILYILLNKLILPSIDSIFSQRKKFIQSNVNINESLRSQIETLQNRYDNEMEEIEKLKFKIRNETLIKMRDSFVLKIQKNNEILKSQHTELDQELNKQHYSFSLSLKDSTISLSELIIEKITSSKIDKNLLISLYNRIKS